MGVPQHGRIGRWEDGGKVPQETSTKAVPKEARLETFEKKSKYNFEFLRIFKLKVLKVLENLKSPKILSDTLEVLEVEKVSWRRLS